MKKIGQNSEKMINIIDFNLFAGDDTWGGWSSTFEEPDQSEAVEAPRVESSEIAPHAEDNSAQELPYENPSFHTLLQTYAPVPLQTQTSAFFEQSSYESMSTTDRFILQVPFVYFSI